MVMVINLVSLNKDYLFKRAYNRGIKRVSPGFIMYVYRNNIGKVRVGIVANKKIGCAVKRNRLRRIIKVACLNLYDRMKPGLDLVFIARFKALSYKVYDIQREMFFNAKSIKIIKAF